MRSSPCQFGWKKSGTRLIKFERIFGKEKVVVLDYHASEEEGLGVEFIWRGVINATNACEEAKIIARERKKGKQGKNKINSGEMFPVDHDLFGKVDHWWEAQCHNNAWKKAERDECKHLGSAKDVCISEAYAFLEVFGRIFRGNLSIPSSLNERDGRSVRAVQRQTLQHRRKKCVAESDLAKFIFRVRISEDWLL